MNPPMPFRRTWVRVTLWGVCLAVESDGQGGYYKVKDGSKRVVHITHIQEGNKL